jgi:hypothetical protein
MGFGRHGPHACHQLGANYRALAGRKERALVGRQARRGTHTAEHTERSIRS